MSSLLDAARIPSKWKKFAACVIDRESGGTLNDYTSGMGARNSSSSAAGRWQFLDNSWRHGLAFMVKDRLVRAGFPRNDARELRVWLQRHDISKWHGIYQDIGFVEVVSRGGAYHWRMAGSPCEEYR